MTNIVSNVARRLIEPWLTETAFRIRDQCMTFFCVAQSPKVISFHGRIEAFSRSGQPYKPGIACVGQIGRRVQRPCGADSA